MLNSIKRIILIPMTLILLLGICSTQTIYASENSNTTHEFTENDIRTFADEILPKQLEKYHIAGATISVVMQNKVRG